MGDASMRNDTSLEMYRYAFSLRCIISDIDHILVGLSTLCGVFTDSAIFAPVESVSTRSESVIL